MLCLYHLHCPRGVLNCTQKHNAWMPNLKALGPKCGIIICLVVEYDKHFSGFGFLPVLLDFVFLLDLCLKEKVLIRSHIDFTQEYRVILKLEMFSYLSCRSVKLSSLIRLEALSLMLLLRGDT